VNFLDPIRTAYDTVADSYHSLLRDELSRRPLDLAMITAFAGLVEGPVADIGCGPGQNTELLRKLGVDAFGIDLSPEMIAVARREYPDLRFEVGSMLALDLPDGTLGGVLSSFSIIHMPPENYPTVFAEFHRVLAPGGHVLISFHVGDQVRHLTEGYGHQISLDVHWLQPDKIIDLLEEAGLSLVAQFVRERSGQEKTRKAVLIARKP
jgi:SAM-dependent methyltransferase